MAIVVLMLMMAGSIVWAAPAGQAPAQAGARPIYDQVRATALTGGRANVTGLALKRDRVEMTFTGTFYFGPPAQGTTTAAVFIGQGTLKAEPPPTAFERENVKRLIGADLVESDFKTAVLRFSDDTMSVIGATREEGGAAPPEAVQLLAETDARLTQQTGVNMAARLTVSLMNAERPGVFSVQVDGGRRGRIGYVFDAQGRIPVSAFNLNGGEKGVIFQHQASILFAEVWMAFHALEDYARNAVEYSDVHDAVDVTKYQLNLDVRGVPRMTISAMMDLTIRAPSVHAVPFNIGESLPESQRLRLLNQLRMKRARIGDQELAWAQEDWEGGFTVFLPAARKAAETLQLTVDLEGEFLQVIPLIPECFYPYDNVTWLPRHGYLDRAEFDMRFRHRKRDKIAASGTRVSESADGTDPQAVITRYTLPHQVPLATFAMGPFDRKTKQVTFEGSGKSIPIEFNSVPGRVLSNLGVGGINSTLIVDELDNAVRYFSAMFGAYPYESFGAAFHPFSFGQGFATLLMIPPVTRPGLNPDSVVYSFFAHETAHQWWGNIVAWRSYRDQWLSEGFAEYSALLYATKRDREPAKASADMVRRLREDLREPPATVTGTGRGRLNDIGPIVYGLRLNTTKTLGAYQALIYSKGALVLRMLHFLFSNPANGDDAAFLAMMKDFVARYANRAARTEDFWAVANEHFARTPIAQKFAIRDLGWFFRQWVYSTGLPSYQLDYEIKAQPDGSLFLSGVLRQDAVDDNWQMVLPLVLTFDGNQEARTTIRATGPSTVVELKLPMRPKKVELDPASWVLSDRTTTRGR